MKKTVTCFSALAALFVFASAEAQEIGESPKKGYRDPNPYGTYKPAMVSTPEQPLSYNWSLANDATLKKATCCKALAAVVADDDSAEALLEKVQGAYKTDALVASQIAAVTQWVMQPDSWYNFLWDGPRAAGRKVWTEELIDRAEDADDVYVKLFCLEQLRFCAYPCQADDILEIGVESKNANVRDFAEMIVRGLKMP